MLVGPVWAQALIPVMWVIEKLLLYSSKAWPPSFEACSELFSDWMPWKKETANEVTWLPSGSLGRAMYFYINRLCAFAPVRGGFREIIPDWEWAKEASLLTEMSLPS